MDEHEGYGKKKVDLGLSNMPGQQPPPKGQASCSPLRLPLFEAPRSCYNKNMRRYKVLDHTADLGAYFYGANPKEVFVNAGLAVFSLMLDRTPRQGYETEKVALEGTDPEDLLVRWLNELLYIFHVRERVAVDIRIEKFRGNALTAVLTLAPFDLENHGVKNDIKAATYHQVALEPIKNRWRARVIFDL